MTPAQRVPGRPSADERIRVLHVEDDETAAELVATSLERETDGLEVVTAPDAERALTRLADDADFDYVISDYDLPDADGIELLERVREDRPGLPFILFTGRGSEGVASAAIDAGVTDYVRKDGYEGQFTLLANRIERAVGRWRAERDRRRQLDAIETAEEGIAILDEDGHFTYVNEAYADIYDYDPDDLLGEHWDTLYPDDEFETIREKVLPAVDVEGHWEGRTEGVRPDGGTVTGEHSVAVTDGGLVSIVRRVTEAVRGDRGLELRVEAMDEAPIGATITGPASQDAPLLYANDSFEELTGYSESEMLGRNHRILQGEGTDPEPVAELRRALEEGESTSVELRNYRKDGTEFWNQVTIAPIEDRTGEVTNYVGFQQDVTDRIERERALREQRELTESIFAALPDPFYAFDGDGNFLYWNERFETVTGYTAEEISAMDPVDFVPDDEVANIADAIATVVEDRERVTVESAFETKGGERVPHEFSGGPLRGADGDLVGVAGIGRDITDRLERERELERQNDRLEEFASVVSHDLRNPLSVAQGYLDLEMQDGNGEHLDDIATAHGRMEQLIDDLLTLARNGQTVEVTERVDLGSVTDDAWQNVGTTDAELVVDADLTVEADGSRLTQLFENLFANAVEHGGEGVTVTVGALESGDGFYVADDGPGIPPDEREVVFEPGHTSSEEGTGFGLRIVERIAEAHGWSIDATESADGGARFEVTGVETAEEAA